MTKDQLLAAIAHDEQISVWAEEMLTDPHVDRHVMEPETYDDGVECAIAFKAAIRELTEKIIERVLDEQCKPSR